MLVYQRVRILFNELIEWQVIDPYQCFTIFEDDRQKIVTMFFLWNLGI